MPAGKSPSEERLESGTGDARAASAAPVSLDRFVLRYGVYCLIGFALLNGWMFWKLRDSILQGYGDFASFYPAGQAVRSGDSARLYEAGLQRKLQEQFPASVRGRRGPLPYIRPPFEALLFVPFSYLKYAPACIVWAAIKIILLLVAAGILSNIRERERGISNYGLILLLSLAFFPVAYDLIVGQDSILLLLIMAVGLKRLVRGKELECGAVLALGLFKFHLMIPMVAIFALRKKGKLVVGFLAMATVLVMISWMMVGTAGLRFYPRYLWTLNRVPELGMVQVRNMPNLRGLLSSVLGNGTYPEAAHWFLGAMVVVGIGVASRSWRGDDRDSVIAAFCFSIVITLATSYYANGYDLTLLLVPLVLLGNAFFRRREISGWPRMLFLGSAAGLLFTPLLWALMLRVQQFRWVGIVVLGLAISIPAAEKYRRQIAESD